MPVADAGGPPADLLTAHHEAAHAVVALALQLPLNGITREIEGWGLAGSTGYSLPADWSEETYEKHPELARSIAVVDFAGVAAELRMARSIDLAEAGGDIKQAYGIADAIAGNDWVAFERECQNEAFALVAKHWPAIEAVAGELAASHEPYLDGDAVRQICLPFGVETPTLDG